MKSKQSTENEQGILIDAFLNRIHEWPKDTQKMCLRSLPLGKCKSKPLCTHEND